MLSDPIRIRYMIDNITSIDPDLKAGIAQIRTNANGARSNFEAAVNILLPLDPYKPTRKRIRTADVGSVTAGAGKPNSGTGSTGVEIRYYKASEFKRLSSEQKRELMEYCKKRKAEGKGNSKPNSTSSNSKKGKAISNAEIKSAIIELMSDHKERETVISALSSVGHGAEERSTERRASDLKTKYDTLAPRINKIVRQHSERGKGSG